jgi:hypothetical protein
MKKVGSPLKKSIPPSWDGVLWYFFILYHLEQMELIGPMIGTALDVVTLSLPVAADIVSDVITTIVSLAPIPYANFAGSAIGYAVSLCLIAFAVVLNGSRKHFGSAFKSSLEAVPVFGDILVEASQSIETGAERYLQARKKVLNSVNKISPSATQFLDYYSPDVEIHNEPPPIVSIPEIKRNVIDYVAKESGITVGGFQKRKTRTYKNRRK